MKRLWLVFAQTVTVLVAVLFVVATLQPQWLGRRSLPSVVPVFEAPSSAPPPADPGTLSLRAAAKIAAPAVVSINTSKAPANNPHSVDPWFRFFFGDQLNNQPQTGLGSGVIVSPAGYVLTNNHVVEEADEIQVSLNDGRQTVAKVIGTDPETDLAVLKVELSDLPVITLGNSDALQIGDPLLAIGNPFGVGQTVTSGIVSALGRTQLGINTFENFIQTDAAINPGNSGGALVDVQGHLMGINTAIYSRSGGSMGIGFAIPTSTARSVMEAIVKEGKVTRGWIGVEPQDLTPELAESFGVGTRSGVIITGVLQNGPAAQAGIRPGDVITAVKGQEVRNVPQLLAAVAALPPGEKARLDVLRRDASMQIEVTPGRRNLAQQAANRR
ncbi:MAG: Do family serine endopeptidase [Hydrogenophaga sp.]|uniref:Do family serine endopeptidase n=1 Tax=Hydrogenophaga sp. TaxID=1904254 RepID=UPI001691400D|nr:Do family serine endopeptidase [Hydrogenophaga sp.]NIM42557.1 Do family serine endopeptidase [Hydrogenophaga sp.]NIN27708.1 Do family serine endopeptidase [Hydrogenophaga sp.]NIN32528.1 Do family serine endopeptidase [Hydrogenophaga sp.]NIN56979.1 Do family serine endopeptidase [Hydrogenophaga sp.]NIO53124.1 Do family serine endopeptidase [Hydrogenophaga sp.]